MGMVSSEQIHRVSVIVPTRDRPALLREALQSIRALERDGVTFEILVGDNGTLDDTVAVTKAAGGIHLRTTKNGAGAARNIALRAATGNYIAFLDDDDLWTLNHIHEHIALLESDRRLAAVMGQIVTTDTERQPSGEPWPHTIPQADELVRLMLSGYFPQIGATVLRASVRQSIGEFDERLTGDQDWDFQLRTARRYPIGFVAKPCVLFRQRPPGAFDKLQLTRVRFTRKVFFRHAIPEWRRWRSPLEFIRGYFGAMTGYYNYFAQAAVDRAAERRRAATLLAIWRAFRIFPTRAVRDMLKQGRLRRAFLMAISGKWPVAEQPDLSLPCAPARPSQNPPL
jgi:glycosyltransferase involved in cell wall biosynthesis